jgi:hypothetical protein
MISILVRIWKENCNETHIALPDEIALFKVTDGHNLRISTNLSTPFVNANLPLLLALGVYRGQDWP